MVLLRHLLFALVAFPATVLGFLFATLAHLLTPRRWGLADAVARAWGRALALAAGCHVVVEGRQHVAWDRAALLVANHASYLDPPLLIAYTPASLRFVLKKELATVPLIGWYTRVSGHFFLDRERARAGHDVVRLAGECARRLGLWPTVFPEGTRSQDGRLGPLKPGAFQIALEGGLPVQPVAILGTHAVMPKGSWGPRQGGRLVVRFGPSIPAEEAQAAGRKALAERVAAILAALGVPAPGSAPVPPGPA